MAEAVGNWTVAANGERGSLTATRQGLELSLGTSARSFAWSDGVELEYPTPYSVRIHQGDEATALGFSSTAEAQSFRRTMSPTAPPDQTVVMRTPSPIAALPARTLQLRALWLGLLVQLVGAVFIAAGWGETAAVFAGFLLAWLGALPVLGAVIAWSVETGLASKPGEPTDLP